jgi:hypothetical protein
LIGIIHESPSEVFVEVPAAADLRKIERKTERKEEV